MTVPPYRLARCVRGRARASAIVAVSLAAAFWAVATGGGGSETDAEKDFRTSSIVRGRQCTVCHTIGSEGGTVGPVLNHVGNRRSEAWLRKWLTNPNAVKPGTKMPRFPFTGEELDELVAGLGRLRTEVPSESILQSGDSPEEKGRRLFEAYDCYACHRVGREGRFIGPDLTWVGHRRTEAWESNWLKDPPAYKPGTFMPNFGLSAAEIDALTAYLHTLAGQENKASRRWEQTTAFYLDLRPTARGELVYKRLACWACHGEKGKGGIRNDNEAPDGRTPPLSNFLLKHEDAELEELIASGRPASRTDAAGPEPFGCPAYSAALEEQEMKDLVTFLHTLTPKKAAWQFR